MISSLRPELGTSLALLRSSSAAPSDQNSSSPLAATASAVTRTADPFINGLLSGSKWATSTLAYGFPSSSEQYEYAGERDRAFQPAGTAQKSAVERALVNFASVANLSFEEVESGAAATADLRFANSGLPATAWAYLPSSDARGGDVWFNGANASYASPGVGTYGYQTILHEIGHAVGLKHAHEKEGVFAALPTSHRSMEYTVMSYSSYLGASTTSGYTNQQASYAQTLMMDDIAAIQAMYGANYTTNATNTTYTWSATTGEMSINGVGQGAPTANRVFMTVWDGGGTDTYDFASYLSDLSVDLNPGQWTRTSAAQLADLHYNGAKKAIGNIANAKLFNKDLRSLIENATGGGGNDKLVGNQSTNRLTGGAGTDTLNGGAGDDRLIGGAGADLLMGGAGYDVVDYADGISGVVLDMLRGGTGGDALGDKLTGIEEVVGTSFDDTILAGSTAAKLVGGAGNDALTGGNAADTLEGGLGDDTLTGGRGRDTMTGGSGRDTFRFMTVADSSKIASLRDLITDFSLADDMIDLGAVDANTLVAGNQSFVVLDETNARFTAAGQVRIRHETTSTGTRTILEGNVDSNNGADFQIELTGRIDSISSMRLTL